MKDDARSTFMCECCFISVLLGERICLSNYSCEHGNGKKRALDQVICDGIEVEPGSGWLRRVRRWAAADHTRQTGWLLGEYCVPICSMWMPK